MDSQGPLQTTDRIRIYVECRNCGGTGREPGSATGSFNSECGACLNGTSNPSTYRGVFEQTVSVKELSDLLNAVE